MTSDTPTAHRTNLRTGDTAPARHPPLDYHAHSDDRLPECYRRNSRPLREYGPDWRTIRTLCAVEERLPIRDIDPTDVVAELDA